MAKDTGEILKSYESAKDARILLRRIFPAAFTMMCTLLFIAPCCLMVYAARHPVVKHFFGAGYYILVIIPILITLVHFYHVRHGPDKYVTHFALIIPSVLLLVYASVLNSATVNSDRFFSVDCSTAKEKVHLQQEWEAANTLYQSCLNETAASRNLTTAYLAKSFRIQDCTEYEDSLRGHHWDWTYLRQLEENHDCSGFCRPGQQLWSRGPHKDSCTIAIASVFRYVVRVNCVQVIVMSLITLFLDAALVLLQGPAQLLGLLSVGDYAWTASEIL